MKQLVKLSLVPLLAANLFASSFIFVEEGISLPLADGSVVYSGTPVEVIGNEGDNVKVKVKGVVGDKEPSSVYATKNLVLILAKAKDAGMIKKSGDEATVELLVPAKKMLQIAKIRPGIRVRIDTMRNVLNATQVKLS